MFVYLWGCINTSEAKGIFLVIAVFIFLFIEFEKCIPKESVDKFSNLFYQFFFDFILTWDWDVFQTCLDVKWVHNSESLVTLLAAVWSSDCFNKLMHREPTIWRIRLTGYPVRNVCKSVERTHQKLGFGVTLSNIIKRLYFKLLQIVSFNTMVLIGMKSSEN